MTFNSIQFALFLPIFLILFYSIYKKERSRDILLLLGSYFFYMTWYWQYASLIAFSTVIDYFVGQKMAKEANQKKRKALLLISLVVNLGILAIFKYYNFFFETSQEILFILGFEISDYYHKLLLPVGISFYTFQTLSYTLDIYRKEIEPESSFIKFSVFVSFFPQLVAGPIVRAKDFLPQLRLPTRVKVEEFEFGMQMIFIGLVKKILIADLLAYLAVDAVFESPQNYSSIDLLVGLYAYTFQIYCDFSGYSDIAIGVALLLGFKLPINFNRPYISQTPSEFWKRWHISLSSWLRDYLYISLGGNRFGKWLTYRNLFITMLLGGLWHGAAMNFVLWGAFHGFILILSRKITSEQTFNKKAVLKIFINFHLIVFSWLLFRVTGMENFFDYINGLVQFEGGTTLSPLLYIILTFALVVHLTPKRSIDIFIYQRFSGTNVLIKSSLYVLMLLLFVGASIGTPVFIYFQF